MPGAPGVPGVVAPAASADDLVSYRWQIVVVDMVGLSVTLGSIQNSGGAKIGGLTYLFAAPIVHAMHARGGRALGSLALRVAMPFIGALAGAALAGHRTCAQDEFDCDDEGPFVGALLGLGVGGISAMIVDAAFITQPVPRSNPGWTPQLSITPQRTTFGVAARF